MLAEFHGEGQDNPVGNLAPTAELLLSGCVRSPCVKRATWGGKNGGDGNIFSLLFLFLFFPWFVLKVVQIVKVQS